jgi:hypothetical protein
LRETDISKYHGENATNNKGDIGPVSHSVRDEMDALAPSPVFATIPTAAAAGLS